MKETKQCLKDLIVFQNLDPEELELLCQNSYAKLYKKDEIIFFENDSVKKLYLLVNGKVKLSMLSAEGKEKVLTILQEGDIFGELSLFDEDPHPLTAEAMDDARLLIIPWNEMEKMIIKRPSLAIKIIEALSKKTRLLTSQVRELVFQDAAGRLASLLSRLAEDFGREIEEGTVIDLVLTHQEIANLIGSSRVTVTKLINKFIDDGMITIKKRKIIIKDFESLGERLQTIF
ncbi:MAG: CRP/FNR family transcriptional regulator, anaerobic regulatory protein [Halanaerobium sp. 4-GBenrich]|mgnify:FL=1|jgi:CRP/FNR family transcriptional regulator|uniref:CRP/FNR family transcriptional regulator n=1 Tax=Halanaerobium congolense TaxID=54121 RepID=A0A1M7H815_9FIRM|nr:Crp/Fnr family transcriptional regulator [Halanaerobium congolense]KXS49131.1 MAG: CRP/FNR family transcriptional regulator, anaerobic regulatory protein [Halanaerobium sp. T82-1]ODS50097.1 MAG: CRP/FNR family transcriptional regulator, anaerobic regulatory protein [Halanaerobium sp. 4-GBenrich]PUU92414.1 MAG: CRP/FNR family transcriptional regulator, anaerobic regulatory protein [Halanaerobium sp.]PTX16987.1 CRP/FNR family transcriptional regulator [Halanaerobium congolense]TDP27050.1 CRP/